MENFIFCAVLNGVFKVKSIGLIVSSTDEASSTDKVAEPCEISKMELFTKIIERFHILWFHRKSYGGITKLIQENKIRKDQKDFEDCFCIKFSCYDQILIFGSETRH